MAGMGHRKNMIFYLLIKLSLAFWKENILNSKHENESLLGNVKGNFTLEICLKEVMDLPFHTILHHALLFT